MTGQQAMSQRTFARRHILRVTSHGYAAGVRLLAEAIRVRLGPAAAVVGIANGGLPPARALGNLLAVPVYQVDARHNPTDAPYTQATGRVSYDLDPLTSILAGSRLTGRVLLVDDICGTGATFDALRPPLSAHLAAEAALHTVALCRNVGAARDPDLWLWAVEDWVHFPWEAPLPPGETVADLPMAEQVHPR
jgi:hypoxanthine phosphoribosyltransferase